MAQLSLCYRNHSRKPEGRESSQGFCPGIGRSPARLHASSNVECESSVLSARHSTEGRLCEVGAGLYEITSASASSHCLTLSWSRRSLPHRHSAATRRSTSPSPPALVTRSRSWSFAAALPHGSGVTTCTRVPATPASRARALASRSR
eukprot:scaffold1510_cov83-Phaeocystis_antarctica.AAC.2